MTQFLLMQSGLFSGADYDETSRTLSVTFRTSGETYDVPSVTPEQAAEFMSMEGKSGYWHSVLKHKGAVRR